MHKIKNGLKVADLRLARIAQFDKRSKAYPIRELVSDQEPRSYTWPCSKVLDQGQEGACVGFSVAHELIARPVSVSGITAKFAIEKIYWEAQKNDPWDGGAYPGAKPFYEGTSVIEGIKAAQRLGYIEEYRWAFSLEDLVLAVGHCGPAVLGLNWYEGMFEPHGCGFIHKTGELAGGHAILCRGVNVKERYFTLHNSWGPSWGNKGCAKISWDELQALLDEQGEAVIPTKRSA